MTDTITEIEVLPLEKVIEQTLVRENVTDKVIAELKVKYGDLRLKSLDDHENYLEITFARKIVRKVGVLAEKICKAGREDAIKTQKLWLAKEKEVLGKIDEVQKPLDTELKKFEDEKERKEQELIRKQEAAFQSRQQSIIRLGATWQNDSFVLGEISYEVNIIKETDDEMWEGVIFPKYQKVFDRIEAERVAEENKRREEDEKLKAEQEQFRKDQEAFRQQQLEFAKLKEESDRLRREAQDRIDKEAKDRHQAIIQIRGSELTALGMLYSYRDGKFHYEDLAIPNEDVINLPDDQWSRTVAAYEPLIKELKVKSDAKKEETRLAELEQAKEQARKQELDRIAEAERQKAIIAQQQEAKRLEELAKAGDKANWDDFIGKLKAIQVPALKSGQYRRIAQIAKEKIEEAIALKP